LASMGNKKGMEKHHQVALPHLFESGRFTEDGSFIGQYGPGNGKKKQEEPPALSSVATYV